MVEGGARKMKYFRYEILPEILYGLSYFLMGASVGILFNTLVINLI